MPNVSRAAVALGFAVLTSAAFAEEDGALLARPEPLMSFQADVVGGANPRGLSTQFGAYRRWVTNTDPENPLWDELYFRLGATVEPNPAWTQVSIYAEWVPINIVQLRVRYDVYGFYGRSQALLSFDKDDDFGDDERDDLEDLDAEESGWGQRIMFQPVLRFQWEWLIVRNSSELGIYFLPGRGPYVLELEFDTLVKEDLGGLFANRTQVLAEVWEDAPATLVVGVQYEAVHAFDSGVTRQRLGVVAYWVPLKTVGPFDRPRVYLWTGWNIQDRNRDDEFFIVAGLGFDLDLLE
jgi:hypothetical protein